MQEDEERWVLAIDYSIDAEALTDRPRGGRPALPELCARLESEPRRLLHDLSPPFSLVWHHKPTGSFYAICDGLGVAKLYEYRDGARWALNNRISAFAALGLPLEPDLEMWMARWALNWFLANGSADRRRAPGVERYNSKVFWRDHAEPMMDAALRSDGLWCEVFEPGQARDRWWKEHEELAITAHLPQALAELDLRVREADSCLR